MYSIIFDAEKSLDWKKKPVLGRGLMTDTAAGLTGKGSMMNVGIGGEIKFLWLFSYYYGIGYAKFLNDVPYKIDGKNCNKKFDGAMSFWGISAEYPFTRNIDVGSGDVL